MHLKITGKNFDIGDSFREYVTDRIHEILEKLFNDNSQGHIIIEKEGSGYRSQVAIGLDSGVHLQSKGTNQDVYGAFNQASERLEKQLRRYKRRLNDHHEHENGISNLEGLNPGVFFHQPSSGESAAQEEDASVIIAENFDNLQNLSVGEAAIELDLSKAALVMFKNASTGGLNVVFRREDGNIGWIDPERSK